MGSNLRELRQRRKSVSATKKITKAMELIAASRINKAQRIAAQALPYTRELNHAVAAVASDTDLKNRMLAEVDNPRRVGLLVMTSDRGMNGAYSSNAIKTANRLTQKLLDEGKEIRRYSVGRKVKSYLDFRNLPQEAYWLGISDAPKYENALEIADRLIADFERPYEQGGLDEVYAVYTRMESMLTQTPRVRRLLPVTVEARDKSELGHIPMYEFEPNADEVLKQLLPLYLRSRIYFYLLQSAASQLASQQRAMKSATDNAENLIEDLTRESNQARQAEITQEITEIVGGASALSEA